MSGFEAVVSDHVMVRCDGRLTLEQRIAAMDLHDVAPAVRQFMRRQTGGPMGTSYTTRGVALDGAVLGPLGNLRWSEVPGPSWVESGPWWPRHIARVLEALESLELAGDVDRTEGPDPGPYWMWIDDETAAAMEATA